jgi:phenylalanyl-tRNA synthetase beta subunit
MSTILINSVLYYSMAYKLKLKSMEKTLKNNPKNTERENL